MNHLVKIAVGATFATTLSISSTALEAHQQGDLIFRAGIARVMPNDDSDGVIGSNGLGLVAGEDGVSVDGATGVGFSGTWMMTERWGLDLLAALPFTHDIRGNGAIEGLDIGETKHLPPTLSLQYYPDFGSGRFQPYVGLGINYTLFFEEDTDSELTGALNSILGGVTSTELELEDSVGLAAQLGADWQLTEKLSFNASVWYMDIDTEASVKVNGATAVKVDVEIDPWVAMLGVAYRFR